MIANYCQKHHSTVTNESGECYICAEIRERKARQAAHVAELIANPPQYLYNTWGYDQTNVTFYRVTRATAKSLFGVEVRSHCLGEDGFMTGLSVPTELERGNEIRLPLANLDRYEKPVRISWYA